MKRLLMAFTAIAALAGPLAAPVGAIAQSREDRAREDRPARPLLRPSTLTKQSPAALWVAGLEEAEPINERARH